MSVISNVHMLQSGYTALLTQAVHIVVALFGPVFTNRFAARRGNWAGLIVPPQLQLFYRNSSTSKDNISLCVWNVA